MTNKGLPTRGDVKSLSDYQRENLTEKQFLDWVVGKANGTNTHDYYMVPVNLLKRADLSDTEKLVGALLLSYEGKFGPGIVAVSMKTMAEDLGKEAQAISKAVRGLKEKGFITYGRSSNSFCYRYKIDSLKDCGEGPEPQRKPKRECRNGLAGSSKHVPMKQKATLEATHQP